MIRFDEWYLPNGEQHLQQWMTKVNQRVDGRLTYQNDKIQRALSFCKTFRNAVDVGGHCGLIAWHLTKRFNHTYAFEPIPAHRECFLKNVEGEFTLFKCALGDVDDMCSLATEIGSSGNTTVNKDISGTIQMHRLDGFGLKEIDFLKADVEGYELFAMRGAEQLLLRDKPIIMVEQKPGKAQQYGLGETDAVKYLESLGAKKLCKPMSGDYFLGW